MESSIKISAIKLRKRGVSIRKIEQRLSIPRSTLGGWFKNIELTPKQKEKLFQDWQNGLVKARRKAVIWHNAQKEARLEAAKSEANQVLEKLDFKNNNILEIALAMLYLGEGSKRNVETALGSSDPNILRFFLAALKKLYNFNVERVRCELYLRADQDPGEMKLFWSRRLHLPLDCFKQISIDSRTRGSQTYATYKGVCNIRCSHVAIQRKLLYLSEAFINQTVRNAGG